MDVKEEYDKLRKKHSVLPKFDVTDHEFEICTIEKPNFLLRQVRRKIHERIDELRSHLASILQPDPTSFTDTYEFSCFTRSDQNKILDLYKRLMLLYRDLSEADLELDDALDAKLISRTVEEWPKLRKEALTYLKKLKNCWIRTSESKEILEYLG